MLRTRGQRLCCSARVRLLEFLEQKMRIFWRKKKKRCKFIEFEFEFRAVFDLEGQDKIRMASDFFYFMSAIHGHTK